MAGERLVLALDIAQNAAEIDAVTAAVGQIFDLSNRDQRSRLRLLLEIAERKRDALVDPDPQQVQLRARLILLLKLLLHNDDAAETAEIQPLLSLIASSSLPLPEAVEHDVSKADRAWGRVMVKGFARGQEAVSVLALAPLVDHRSRLERELKKAAMHLVAVGAELPGVEEDAVPLVAYSLLAGVLPAGPRAENDELEDRLIDAMLRVADTSAKLPAEERLMFVAYYRLAFLLGIAEGYAERLSISRLTFS